MSREIKAIAVVQEKNSCIPVASENYVDGGSHKSPLMCSVVEFRRLPESAVNNIEM